MVDLEKKSKFFKALSDPIRLKIVRYLLSGKECTCTCDLTKLIKRDQSVIFRHIQILKDAGIITTEKKACFLTCRLKNKKHIRKYMGD
jgi:ArsR family transcriptional regulator